MELQKEKWNKTILKDCCTFYRGVTYSKNDEVDYGGIGILRANNIDLSNKINFENIKRISSDLIIKEEKRLRKNDIFICTASGSLGHIGKVAFINSDTEYFAGGFMGIIRPKFDYVNPYFLFNVFLSPIFINLMQSQRAGTNIQNLKFSDIANNVIPLPSFEEQIQIAELFQSIETTIEQTEKNERSLIKLKKILGNNLVSKEPEFGNLLNKGNTTSTNFGKIVDCIEQHDKRKKNVSRFIGLENIEPENLKISTWGNVENGTTFTKRFSIGDVLFGKRRAYLKKVAIANFNGICSGDILVFRAKENMILSELLAFYVSAEPFINHAISTSAGSISPRTKWKDLSLFEFSIPDLKAQARILEVFQQIETTLEQIRIQRQTLKNLKQKLLNEILG